MIEDIALTAIILLMCGVFIVALFVVLNAVDAWQNGSVHEPPVKNRSTGVDDLQIAKYRCRTCLRPLYNDIQPGEPGALYFADGKPYCLEHYPRSGT